MRMNEPLMNYDYKEAQSHIVEDVWAIDGSRL